MSGLKYMNRKVESWREQQRMKMMQDIDAKRAKFEEECKRETYLISQQIESFVEMTQQFICSIGEGYDVSEEEVRIPKHPNFTDMKNVPECVVQWLEEIYQTEITDAAVSRDHIQIYFGEPFVILRNRHEAALQKYKTMIQKAQDD
jgi:hypothetical protein